MWAHSAFSSSSSSSIAPPLHQDYSVSSREKTRPAAGCNAPVASVWYDSAMGVHGKTSCAPQMLFFSIFPWFSSKTQMLRYPKAREIDLLPFQPVTRGGTVLVIFKL